jgi:hypothetical protein
MCRVVDTVLIDQEMVYAPRQGNDRLLLGLKGSLNEYELDLLRQRSLSARYEKARRGELIVTAPVGFVALEVDKPTSVRCPPRCLRFWLPAALLRAPRGKWNVEPATIAVYPETRE